MRRRKDMPSSSRTDVSLSWSGAKNKIFGQTLAWRPAESAASKQMQMEMENGLARAAAIIEHGAVAFEEVAFAGELRGDQLKFAKDSLIFRCGFVQRFEMFAWTNQDVRGRLRA